MLARMYNEVGLTLYQIVKKEGYFAYINDGLVLAVKKGIETFNKYYGLIEKHDLYYIATVLDP
jgi:hypothetical protein